MQISDELYNSLPLCPLCGSAPETEIELDEYQKPELQISCSKESCGISTMWYTEAEWCNRPIEDKLIFKIKVAEQCFQKIIEQTYTEDVDTYERLIHVLKNIAKFALMEINK